MEPEEFNNIEKTTIIQASLAQARLYPTSIDEYLLNLRTQENPTVFPGFVVLESETDLRIALTILGKEFGLDAQGINTALEHEIDHIKKAKELYGDEVVYSYGVHFLKTKDNRIAFAPRYIVIPPEGLSSDILRANAEIIAQGVHSPSIGDSEVGKS